MLLVLIITIGGARDIAAQEQPLTVKINGFSAADLSHAQAVITVLDTSGHPLSGLAKDSFTAKLDDTPISTVRLSQGIESSLPLTVVLALDVGGGMQGPPLEQAKLAAEGFVDALGPQDSIAVFAFADTVSLVQPFTIDHAAAHAAIGGLSAGGSSQLYRATLQSVLQASASADTGRRAVVLLSSAHDVGNESPEQALFAAQALGVPVFGIGLGSNLDGDYLHRLVDVSGGQFTQTATPEGLVPLYQGVAELLRDQYILTVDASSGTSHAPAPATLSITVAGADGSGSDQRLVCPQRLCIALDDLTASDHLAAPRTVTASVVSSDPVTSVTFFVDGQAAATVKASPYQFTIDPKQYAAGQHAIAAEAATGSDTVRTKDVPLRLGATTSSGRSGVMAIGAVIAVVLVGILLLAYLILRPRGRRQGPQPASPPDTPKTRAMPEARTGLHLLEPSEGQAPQPAPEPIAELGRLYVTNGPIAGQEFAIGSTPVSIGSGHRCTIRLPRELDAGGEIAPEFARIWIREDHLMVHELRRLTVAGPVGGRWEMLKDGDVFSIGPFSFRFELGMRRKEEEEQPEPLPDIFRSKEAPADTADSNAPQQPATAGPEFEGDESTPESPPQAAAAP